MKIVRFPLLIFFTSSYGFELSSVLLFQPEGLSLTLIGRQVN